MSTHERDPFQEDPQPSFVEVDAVDLEAAWEGEGGHKAVCPGCEVEPKGRFAEKGTSTGRDWVAFAPCGHVAVLAGWAVY
ncbi:hypothetical protein KDL01_32505 [Actinospica durhamensis]|uniref:Uncharacterized protein n=1 Tax=Actinospica durhamensis TaxID=1508375 RepID=A0A941ETF8_9ACTN|nr:hypothetical protein [Actinospica durhamensis]MBR7838040.1 hypothetical protein [Actinospica durhamensis]